MPNLENETWIKTLLYGLLEAFLICLAMIPVLAHFVAALFYLPQLHHFIREELDPIWRYHIADSSVTVGLAYYAIMLFLLWKSRLLGWKASRSLFNFVVDKFDNSLYAKRNTTSNNSQSTNNLAENNLATDSH